MAFPLSAEVVIFSVPRTRGNICGNVALPVVESHNVMRVGSVDHHQDPPHCISHRAAAAVDIVGIGPEGLEVLGIRVGLGPVSFQHPRIWVVAGDGPAG